MATKSENAPITNTYGPGARPIQYEPVSIACQVIKLSEFHKVVMAQFSVRPLFFRYIHISAIFGWFKKMTPKVSNKVDIIGKLCHPKLVGPRVLQHHIHCKLIHSVLEMDAFSDSVTMGMGVESTFFPQIWLIPKVLLYWNIWFSVSASNCINDLSAPSACWVRKHGKHQSDKSKPDSR